MDRKEKHVYENEKREEYVNSDQISRSMPAEGRERKRENTRKINKLWLWLGVLILVFILLWWLFTMGVFGDMTGFFNG